MRFFNNIVVLSFFCFFSAGVDAQAVVSYKLKNASNERDRTAMLDILRARLYEDYRQEFVFVVDKFNVSSGYAWFQGDVQRKDGRQVYLPDGDGADCCHVEALFKKSGGKWYIVQSGAFSMDVWWEQLWRTTGAPRAIFY